MNGFAAMFCGNCGGALHRERVEGEGWVAEEAGVYGGDGEGGDLHWRQLSVLFCDLVGYTRLSSEWDAEALRDVLGEYQGLCQGMVERWGGVVARYEGDGVLAYFGYPKAHEDNARRGVEAGLGIQKSLEERRGPLLRARIGLATGWVVAGGGSVSGYAPSLASRVQGAAGVGGVAVDGSTRELSRGWFEFRALGVLGGLSRREVAYGVLGRRRPEDGAGLPLLGRREECRDLMRQWRRALGGHGQVALVCGERGMGKSRLLRELRRRVGNGAVRWSHQCRPEEMGVALGPLRELSGRLSRLRNARRSRGMLPSMARAVQECAESSPPSHALLLRLLQTVERSGRAALLVLEDAQHLDHSSHRLLDALAPALRRRRVMLALSFAPECAPQWLEHMHVRLYRLHRLPAPAAGRLARRVDARNHRRAATLGDGVPLFVIEQSLQGRTTAARQSRARPPPLWLTDFFTAWLDRQGAAAATARTAAALGAEFSVGMLAAVTDGGRVRLDHHLRQLTAAGILIRRGQKHRFAHRLLHRAAWQSLPRRTRLRLRRNRARGK